MSTGTPKVGQTEMEDQKEEGLLGTSDLMNVLIVVFITLTVLLMLMVLACIVWAVKYSVTCCTRRYQAVQRIQLEDNFKLVEQRVQEQRAARKAAARAAALPARTA
jgi:sensor domain CHASE-containing protein